MESDAEPVVAKSTSTMVQMATLKLPSSFVAQISPASEDLDLTLTFTDQFTLHTFRRRESKRAWSDEQSWSNIGKEVGVQRIDHQRHVTNMIIRTKH